MKNRTTILLLIIFYLINSSYSFSMDTDLSQVNASFWGENNTDRSGYDVSSIGDVNGDGIDDIAIGAYFDSDAGSNAGQTYVIFGSSAQNRWAMDLDLVNANASFWGESNGDNSGVAISGVGDVNGDGIDDFVIGADGDDDGGNGAGQTYLILGSSAPNRWIMDSNLTNANASFWGESLSDNSGIAVSGIGDVNNDGIDDFAIGADGDDDGGSGAGQTYVIFGSNAPNRWTMDQDLSASNASFWGEDSSDFSGIAISGIEDANGDGIDDFIIGAQGDDDGGSFAGQTYVIFGSNAPNRWTMDQDLSTSNASFWGEDAGDTSGFAISGVGDVNGDNLGDFIIGAEGDDDGGSAAGQTYLILGSSAPNRWTMDQDLSASNASFWGEDADDVSGTSVSGVGDVNADTIDDFIIGAPGDEDGGSSAGQTYLILGSSASNRWAMDLDLSNSNGSYLGEDGFDFAGELISGGGDVNNDGLSDFIIGAWGDDDGGSLAGQTYIIFGNGTFASSTSQNTSSGVFPFSGIFIGLLLTIVLFTTLTKK